MSTESPSAQTEEHFDVSVDNATHSVIEEFVWLGLPEHDQLSGLMAEINDAITTIMRPWL